MHLLHRYMSQGIPKFTPQRCRMPPFAPKPTMPKENARSKT
jgi:hypothetical protein